MIQVPDGWEINNFKDLKIKLIDGDRGENYPKENEFSDNGFCVFLSAKNVTKDGFRFNEIQFIEKDKDEKLRKGKLNKNDIVLTTRGTVGNIAYFDNTIKYNHIRINSGMILLRNENKTLETNYLHIFLKSNIFDNQISNTVFGSAQPQLTVKEIEKFFICFPKEKKEQEKIAKILSTLDNAIESTNRIIEKEKNIKTALMQELLTNGIDKNGQIRTPQTHTYKQSELGLIPDEWEVMSLIDVTDKNNRYSFTGGPFGSDLKSSDYVERGVRVIQLQNIGDGEFKNNDFVYTLEQKAQELFSCQIFPNEIIMSKMGDPVGRACLIPNLEEKFIMCSDGIRIKVDLNKFDNYFIFLAINNTSFRNLIERVALGSTRKRIGLIELKTLKLKLPEFEEQKQIAKILTTQDKRIEMEETNLSKFKELKKGLMNDLLSGVVRVKV